MSRHLTLAAGGLLLACLLGSSTPDRAAARLLARQEGPSAHSRNFARTLDGAFEVLEEDSVFRPRRADLVRWAVQALARQAGKELPPDLDQHCRRVPEMTRPEQVAFLRDVHARFWAPGSTDAQALLDGVVRDVLSRVDPYAEWQPADRATWGIDLVLVGVGL